MCGIAGILSITSEGFDLDETRSVLERMCAAIRYRGPDDDGLQFAERVGLGFVRLSIIDLAGGHQPMRSPCGRYTLVFNGELYNFRELRAELEKQGRPFATNSDSEVLLAMYERYGSRMLDRLNGMFAFMIHDAENDSLFGARDRVGIKPMYYSLTRDHFVFASELPAMKASGIVPLEIDGSGFGEYLTFGFTVAPKTIYRSVMELPPGCSIRLCRGAVVVEEYWRVARVDPGPVAMEEAVEQVESLIEDSVKLRRVADVPLGALLSGGIDSGLITAFLSRSQSGPIKTFSVGFEEDAYNELPWARRVAEMYGTDHVEIMCQPDIFELVRHLAVAYGQPFGDSSAIPTFLVCREARKHVTVALSGDGGDEVFAGYGRHTRHVANSIPAWRPLLSLAYAAASTVLPVLTPGLRRLRRAALDDRGRQVASVVLLDSMTRGWLAGDRLRAAMSESDSEQCARNAGGEFEALGGLSRFQSQDLTIFLANDILEKVDRASMLNSLEVRVPLLDHRLVEYGLNLPDSVKNDGTHGKLVLRELARRHLPEGHLQKPKTGFSVPVTKWLRGELKDLMGDCLSECTLAKDGWLSQPAIDAIVATHMRGRSTASGIWLLMIAELWYRDFVGGSHAP